MTIFLSSITKIFNFKKNYTLYLTKSKEAKKKAKKRIIGVAIISIILPIVIIILDLWFDIVDLLNSNNKFNVIIIRTIMYSLMAILSICASVKEFKNLPETEENEYEKVCQKYKIESNN